MPTKKAPRKGSLQFWPRVRAKKDIARVRSWPASTETKISGFAGYKVGMTHVIATDNKSTSMTKGQDISIPVTILECPPLFVASIVFYKNNLPISAVSASNFKKQLSKAISIPKKTKKIEEIKDFDDLRLLVHTQPYLTTIGNKKPRLFEIPLSGKNEEKLNYAKENLGKEINLSDILAEGQSIDVHSITKGKGMQGPVKRFGVAIRQHKSEKTKRGPGNLGAWTGARIWRVPQAGQLGYNQRVEYNKWVLKIGDNLEEINKSSGYKKYGIIKNQYILVKGSIPGPNKRIVIFTNPLRENKKIPKEAATISHISRK
ncbi:50S ribosomal protein L3 [Candidatus Woesearchaeota archaeon]|nr:50S ribosomal protein L3 [Candidatus Woesearchaeota archaeon]